MSFPRGIEEGNFGLPIAGEREEETIRKLFGPGVRFHHILFHREKKASFRAPQETKEAAEGERADLLSGLSGELLADFEANLTIDPIGKGDEYFRHGQGWKRHGIDDGTQH